MLRFVTAFSVFVTVFGAPHVKSNLPQLDGRIVGGEAISIEEVNHTVSLLYQGSHRCGGSLISNTYVVTAAHCVDGLTAATLQIRAGSSIRNSGGVIVQVSSVAVHPLYNEWNIDYDIAVLGLGSALTLSPSIGTIALPQPNQYTPEGTYTVVTGWGALNEGGALSASLQVVYVPLVGQVACRSAYGTSSITDRMLCAGYPEGGRDACQGDSGGPLSFEGILLGIVSWGLGCARPSYPGVYANVPNLRQFITDVTNI